MHGYSISEPTTVQYNQKLNRSV